MKAINLILIIAMLFGNAPDVWALPIAYGFKLDCVLLR